MKPGLDEAGFTLSEAQLRAIADAAARAAIDVWEAKNRSVGVKHHGMKAICAAVSRTIGIPEPSPTTVRLWIKTKRFPVEHGAVGMFVSQWALERWASQVHPTRRMK